MSSPNRLSDVAPSASNAPSSSAPSPFAPSSFAPWGRILRETLWASATGFASLVIAVLTLRISIADLTMRWQSNVADDQVQHYLVATSVTDNPFLGPNDRMGFPTTQNLFFAPNYDPASAVFLWFESLFTSDGILILNVYHVLGFFSVGFAAYFLFRALRVRRVIGIVFSLVFALAPYHFQRVSFGHAFVANYWAVPVIGILVLMIASPRTDPFAGWVAGAPSRAGRIIRRLVPIVVLTLALSLSLSYYFVFAVIILGGVFLARGISTLAQRERLRVLIWPAVTIVTLLVFIGVQLAILSLNFDDRYSKYFGERSGEESEVHAGRLTSLLMPWAGTGFQYLGNLTKSYLSQTTVSIFAEPPGTPIIAAIGMVLAIAFVLVRALSYPALSNPALSGPGLTDRTAKSSALTRFLRDDRAGAFSVAFLWGLLFYVVAGLGAIFAFAISGEIRAWVRMSILLVMFGLGFLAVLLDMTLSRRRALFPVIGVIVVIAAVDQLAGVGSAINLQATDDKELRAFVASAESLLDDNCGVVQLPLKAYPASGPIGNMSDYNQVLPYVLSTSNSLRWSYGAVSGTRSGDYWAAVSSPADFEAAVRDSGACAIEVDLAAYPTAEDARDWTSLVDSVADSSTPALESEDAEHRYLLFTVEPS